MAPSSKRKTNQIEEISFDNDARAEYLTGFHKRKVHRIKVAQQENAKKDRELRIETRKNIREQRKKNLEEHVEIVNKLLRRANGEETENDSDSDENGSEDQKVKPEVLDPGREEEYIDEDRYTTVTVEPMTLSDDEDDGSEEEDEGKRTAAAEAAGKANADGSKKKRVWTRKKPDDGKGNKKKKKFKYESPVERKLQRSKQKTKKSNQAKARRGD